MIFLEVKRGAWWVLSVWLVGWYSYLFEDVWLNRLEDVTAAAQRHALSAYAAATFDTDYFAGDSSVAPTAEGAQTQSYDAAGIV